MYVVRKSEDEEEEADVRRQQTVFSNVKINSRLFITITIRFFFCNEIRKLIRMFYD